MQLLLKRAKSFRHGTKKFVKAPGGPYPTPSWVKDTPTYALGIKDGSIINMTAQAEVQEVALAKEEGRKPEKIVPTPEEQEVDNEDGDAGEDGQEGEDTADDGAGDDGDDEGAEEGEEDGAQNTETSAGVTTTSKATPKKKAKGSGKTTKPKKPSPEDNITRS